jgi:hypothetical protein
LFWLGICLRLGGLANLVEWPPRKSYIGISRRANRKTFDAFFDAISSLDGGAGRTSIPAVQNYSINQSCKKELHL